MPMDVTVSKAELVKAMGRVMDFVSRSKVVNEALSCLRLDAHGGKLEILSMDGECSGRTAVPGLSTDSEGRTLIAAQGLKDFLFGCSGDKVRMRVTETGNMIVESGTSKINFRMPKGRTMPESPLDNPEKHLVFTAPPEELAAMFRKTSFISKHGGSGAATADGSVGIVGSFGVRLVVGGTVRAVAHDGKRMGYVSSAATAEGESGWETTMPPRAAAWLSSSNRFTRPVSVFSVNSGAIFSEPEFEVWFHCTNVLLPVLSHMLNEKFEFHAVFNTNDFSRAVESIGKFSEVAIGASVFRRIVITISEGSASIRSDRSIESVEVRDRVFCEHTCPDGTEFMFFTNQLLEFVKAEASDKFRMQFNLPAKMFRMTHQKDKTYSYYLIGSRS